MPAVQDGRPVPGKWWCRLSFGGAGTTHFITETEPILTFYENGTVSFEADENFIVFPSPAFQVYWKVHYPEDGSSFTKLYAEEIKRLDAIEVGSHPAESDTGQQPPDSAPAKPRAVGRNRKDVQG